MIRGRQSRRLLKKRRGAAIIEMAIVLPLLVALVFGIMEFGLLLRDYLAMSQVAREATRSAAVGATTGQIDSTITTWAEKLGFTTSQAQQITVTKNYIVGGGEYPLGNDASGEYNNAPVSSHVAVGLTYTHNMLLGLFGDTKILNTTMVMRRE